MELGGRGGGREVTAHQGKKRGQWSERGVSSSIKAAAERTVCRHRLADTQDFLRATRCSDY